jgi:hypothetical protein
VIAEAGPNRPFVYLPGSRSRVTILVSTMAISVRISDPFLRDELADFLRRATCRVTLQDPWTICVEVHGMGAQKEGSQIELFIAAWRGLHPNVAACRLENGVPSPVETETAPALGGSG